MSTIAKMGIEMRITKADLYYNGLPYPVDSIEFDSSDMSEKEVFQEIRRQFYAKLKIRYYEHNKNDRK
jgi:hypothetical protein